MSERNPQRTYFVVAIFAVAIVLRLVILFTAEKYLRSDEAVVGIMARHILTLGEHPVFLYGQDYGGGHALVAYVAAPLFGLFGMSGALLTSISMCFGLANVALVFLISRRYFPRWVAWSATALYAVAPPVMYGHFLVNGGTEATFFALVALLFFMSDFYDERPRLWRLPLAGLMSGLAFWCMDFTMVYPLTFLVLWLIYRRRQLLHKIALFLPGVVIGALPLISFDLKNKFGHFMEMLPMAGGGSLNRNPFESFASIWTHDLPASLVSDLDNFAPGVSLDSWACYVVLLVGLGACIVWALRRAPKETQGRRPPAEIVPLAYLGLFVALYSLSAFSSPLLRTPRYLLPLYPLLLVAVAAGLYRIPMGRFSLAAATLVVSAVALQGVARDTGMAFSDTHQEHRITTSGKAVRDLARFLEERGIHYAYAPYEIQWRLIFESDERVIVSCADISPISRYPEYDRVVAEAVSAGDKPCAIIFRTDFAFAEIAAREYEGKVAGFVTRERWRQFLEYEKEQGFTYLTAVGGGEFIVFYDRRKGRGQ